MRFILTGSAPISGKVLDFLRIAVGCQVSVCMRIHCSIVALIQRHVHMFKAFFMYTCSKLMTATGFWVNRTLWIVHFQNAFCMYIHVCIHVAVGYKLHYVHVHACRVYICKSMFFFFTKLAFPIIKVFEGYGQTECTAGCSLTLPGDVSTGHVGPPMPCNRIKLVDIKDMNYFASNGEGEVSVYAS